MDLRDSLIRDLIIIGTNDQRLQEKLLSEVDLTLERAVNARRTAELIRQRVEVLQNELRSVHLTRKQVSKKKNRITVNNLLKVRKSFFHQQRKN